MKQGLTRVEAIKRLSLHGPNSLPEKKTRGVFAIFIAQFKNPLIYIITVAAIISLVLSQFEDAAIIGIVIAVDCIVGFFQEYKAEKTMIALRGLLKPITKVIRDGEICEIENAGIVPGDIVMLNPGDKVAADGTLVEIANLSINESILTGESEPIFKRLGENAFMGTTVLSGRGLIQVTSTGTKTHLGKIAQSLTEIKENPTPLQVRLEKFGKMLTYIVIAISIVVFITGLLAKITAFNFEYVAGLVELSVVLAIAAIPEGLIIAVTMILVIGMRAVLRRNGLVKKLLAVETLGSVSTICTDKTGTLTEGNMKVVRTDFRSEQRALQAMVLCNNMEDSLEVSLWNHVESRGEDPRSMVSKFPRIYEIPFSSDTKYMLTINRVDGRDIGFIKGAPDVIMGFCTLRADEKAALTKQLEEWASSGLKMLALAQKEGNDPKTLFGYAWIGFIGIEDPIRTTVKDTIALCRRAGIKVKMITGDYRKTAEKVAMNLGLVVNPDQVVEGKDLDLMNDEDLSHAIKNVVIFCRVTPNHKMRIVEALQHSGEISAMIGDGVNDAPALKKANIGVSVGNGTEVAKETASLILLDNNFTTLVNSVEEGRVIFDNIKKVVAYVLSNSFAEIFVIFGAFILGWPAPLTIAQILWIHLICDGPSDIALGFERGEKGIMEEPPKNVDESILSQKSRFLIITISFSSGALCLVLFYIAWQAGNEMLGRTFVFAVLGVQELIYIFSYRSLTTPVFKSGKIWDNKWLFWSVILGISQVVMGMYLPGLNGVLEVVPLDAIGWTIVLSVSFLMLFIVEFFKFLEKRVKGTPISRISKILQSVQKQMPEIDNLHNLSIDMMKDKIFIRYHFGINAETPLEAAHDIASRIEARIEEQFPVNLRRNLEIVSHIEPSRQFTTKVHSHIQRPSSPEIRKAIEDVVIGFPQVKKWNRLNIIEEGTAVMVAMVVYMDKNMNIAEAHHITEEIETELRQKIKSLKRCNIHSEPFDGS
ncbi:MAG: HAD-IC family P-type ATPase [Candidatus Lokiarchaeota archaeon]|nr:HAD-IC family P-type ATPase [Candidatus Lokiarchaeota archaeon]